MANISEKTAVEIALAYREIKAAEELLDKTKGALDNFRRLDVRDVFGRRVDGLQLGIPSGENGHRCFNLPWSVAGPVIEMHIAQQRAQLSLLTQKALLEAAGDADQAAQDAEGPANERGKGVPRG